jgi:hypothetical protein
MIERRITKVKYKVTDSGERVEIHEVEKRTGPEGEHNIKIEHDCAETPRPEMGAAFRALAPHVREVLELPDDFAEHRLTATTVSFSMSKNDIEGVVISGYVRLEHGEGSWVFNTPHLPFEPYGDKPMACLTDEAVGAVQAVRNEAQAYLNGERAQSGLFDGKMAAAGEKPEASTEEEFRRLQ